MQDPFMSRLDNSPHDKEDGDTDEPIDIMIMNHRRKEISIFFYGFSLGMLAGTSLLLIGTF